MTIALTKFGSKVKIVIDSDTDALYANQSDVDMWYNSADNTISIGIESAEDRYNSLAPIPIANVSIGGVTITSQAVFETQVASVFLSAGGSALTTNPLSQFAATTSAQLAGVISDETGTGSLTFATSPTFLTSVKVDTDGNGGSFQVGTSFEDDEAYNPQWAFRNNNITDFFDGIASGLNIISLATPPNSGSYVSGLFTRAEINAGSTQPIFGLVGNETYAVNRGSGILSNQWGVYTVVQVTGSAVTSNLIGNYITSLVKNTAVITSNYGYYVNPPTLQHSGSIGNNYATWIGDQTNAGITNSYAFWYDSPGVYRIKNDGIMAYYNPTFAKYTAGAVNFERVVQQWSSNVLQYGTEKGGTGVSRDLALITDNTTRLTINGTNGGIIIASISEYADNAAAVTASLAVGTLYRTGDDLKIVHA